MYYVLFILVFLLACDRPSQAFRGVVPQRVSIGDSIFDIRVKEQRAEALRLNSEWAPRRAAVEPRARAAIEKASGCKVARIRGDPAMIVADLSCGSTPAPLPVRGPLECEMDGRPLISGGEVYIDMSCDSPF
jgi:hypothetical protein